MAWVGMRGGELRTRDGVGEVVGSALVGAHGETDVAANRATTASTVPAAPRPTRRAMCRRLFACGRPAD